MDIKTRSRLERVAITACLCQLGVACMNLPESKDVPEIAKSLRLHMQC